MFKSLHGHGLWTDEFGLESSIHFDAADAAQAAQELMKLNGYREHPVRVIAITITQTKES